MINPDIDLSDAFEKPANKADEVTTFEQGDDRETRPDLSPLTINQLLSVFPVLNKDNAGDVVKAQKIIDDINEAAGGKKDPREILFDRVGKMMEEDPAQ